MYPLNVWVKACMLWSRSVHQLRILDMPAAKFSPPGEGNETRTIPFHTGDQGRREAPTFWLISYCVSTPKYWYFRLTGKEGKWLWILEIFIKALPKNQIEIRNVLKKVICDDRYYMAGWSMYDLAITTLPLVWLPLVCIPFSCLPWVIVGITEQEFKSNCLPTNQRSKASFDTADLGRFHLQ